jgi:cytoskeletal protein RodZ
MPKEKFNPIAQLPILPGTEVASDEAQSNVIDSTYPAPEPLVRDTQKPKIEARFKTPVPDEIVIEKESGKNLTVTRTIILFSLIVLVVLGILLTLNFVPRIANSNIISSLGNSFSSIFISKEVHNSTTTSTATTETTPTASTSTHQATASQPATPANLTVSILSTNIVGSQTMVRFNVQNIGGSTSGPWSFSATLPSRETPKYYSEAQAPLTPQSGVIFTLGFIADQYPNTPVQVTLYN